MSLPPFYRRGPWGPGKWGTSPRGSAPKAAAWHLPAPWRSTAGRLSPRGTVTAFSSWKAFTGSSVCPRSFYSGLSSCTSPSPDRGVCRPPIPTTAAGPCLRTASTPAPPVPPPFPGSSLCYFPTQLSRAHNRQRPSSQKKKGKQTPPDSTLLTSQVKCDFPLPEIRGVSLCSSYCWRDLLATFKL